MTTILSIHQLLNLTCRVWQVRDDVAAATAALYTFNCDSKLYQYLYCIPISGIIAPHSWVTISNSCSGTAVSTHTAPEDNYSRALHATGNRQGSKSLMIRGC
jgi:hypothetical protein